MMPILAQATFATESATAAKDLLTFASNWVAENGIKFAVSLFGAVVIYVIGTWLAGLIRSALVKGMSRRGTDQTATTYIANILHWLILVMVIVTALGQLGILTPRAIESLQSKGIQATQQFLGPVE